MKSFRNLPLLAAFGALILYAATFSHGLTANSEALTAKVAGWDGTPLADQPVVWLLTLPARFLPAAWAPLAMNFLSATFAAITLGLLTRTVQLLPLDRGAKTGGGLAGLLPVLLALVLCALEFSFWREATAGSGEMIDVLLLAVVLWQLQEYRAGGGPLWLDAAAVVWGAGVAENWLMLLALPLFVAGLIRLRIGRRPDHVDKHQGLKWNQALLTLATWLWNVKSRGWKALPQLKPLIRLPLLGLAGFTIYALPPLVNGLTPGSPWSPGRAWLISLSRTRAVLGLLYHQFWQAHRILALEVIICLAAPALPFLVSFREKSGRARPTGEQLARWLYRGLCAAALAVCLWFVFDPEFGPRQLIRRDFGVSPPLLAFDYLNAVGAAFLAGNLLSIAKGRPGRSRTENAGQRPAVFAAGLGLLVITTALVARNAPAIHQLNSHPLEQFGGLAADSLPDGGGIMLSDQSQKLVAFQAAMARRGRAGWLAVEVSELPGVEYRARLEHRHPAGWLTPENHHELNPLELSRLVGQIARTNRLFYLHYSYGTFFERFYLVPRGAVYEVKSRDPGSLDLPPPTLAEAAANDQFWTRAWERDLAPFAATLNRPRARWTGRLSRLTLTPEPPAPNRLIADWYSYALDGWGVMLQQQGRWNDARLRFDQALQLDTNNFSARVSLGCNTNHQSGVRVGPADLSRAAAQVGTIARLSVILTNCGPFDDPAHCFLLGEALERSGLPLQAAQQFDRTRILAPGALEPEFALAELCLRLHLSDRAAAVLNHLHQETANLPAIDAVDLELALLDAHYWQSQTNATNARAALESLLRKHPDNPQILNRVATAFFDLGDFTNALELVGARLAKTPDDVPSLNLKAALLMQSTNSAAAIAVLDHVLTLTNLPGVRVNRAYARILHQDYETAEKEYRELETSGREPGPVSYGLATIAEVRGDTNQAMRYFQRCLAGTSPQTLLWNEANAHLQSLKSGLEKK